MIFADANFFGGIIIKHDHKFVICELNGTNGVS
ncbi:Uncharacterised protein [Enterobacter cloacae]|nr:Uncharacterised protein [Enterobacter cloacae]